MTKRLWRAILACALAFAPAVGILAAADVASAHSSCLHAGHYHSAWSGRYYAGLSLHTFGDRGWSVHGHRHSRGTYVRPCRHTHRPPPYFW